MPDATLPLLPPMGAVKYVFPDFPRQVRISSIQRCPSKCFFCLPPGELVMTEQGMQPIETIHSGDMVLTHQGRTRPVQQIMEREYEGPLVQLSIVGLPEPLRLTPEHPVLTDTGWRTAGLLVPGDHVVQALPELCERTSIDLAHEQGLLLHDHSHPRQAKYLTKRRAALELFVREPTIATLTLARRTGMSRGAATRMRVCNTIRDRFPTIVHTDDRFVWLTGAKKHLNRYVIINEDLLFILGLFVAEGHAGLDSHRPNSGHIVFSFGHHEQHLIERTKEICERVFGLRCRVVNRRTTTTVEMYSGFLSRIFRAWMGHRAHNKSVPFWVMQLPNPLLWHFLSGYLAGDGTPSSTYRHPKTGWHSTTGPQASTVSPTLAYQLILIGRLLGVPVNCHKGKSYVRNIEGRPRSTLTRPLFGVRFSRYLTTPLEQTVRPTQYCATIKNVSTVPYQGQVYNFSVEGDESYTHRTVAVHNCHGYGGSNPAVPGGKLAPVIDGRIDLPTWERLLQEIASWPHFLEELCPANFNELFMDHEWFEKLKLVVLYLPQTKIALATTGHLLTIGDNLEKLASIPNLKHVNFSINAYFAESYERIHGRTARVMPKVEQAILRLMQLRPDCHVQVSLVYDSAYLTEIERNLFTRYWSERLGGPQHVMIDYASYADNPLKRPLQQVTIPCRSVYDGLVVLPDLKVLPGCCLPPGQAVFTAHGPVPIQKIHIGQQVLTSKGRWQPVSQIMTHQYSGNIVKIRPQQMPAFAVTPEHPVLTRDGWKPAGKLSTDDLLITPTPAITTGAILDLAEYVKPLTVKRWKHGVTTLPVRVEGRYLRRGVSNPVPRFLSLGTETLIVLGLFLAEGYTTGRGKFSRRAGWAFGKHETDKVERVRLWLKNTLEINSSVTQRHTTLTVHPHSGLLGAILEEWFGHMAWGKHIPSWVLGLDNERLWAFLTGYLMGDGYYARDKAWRGATVSPALAMQLQLIAASLGSYCHVATKVNATHFIEGRSVRNHLVYTWRFPVSLVNWSVERSGVCLDKIATIEWEAYTGSVMNLVVAEDETYLAGLSAVHNCFDASGELEIGRWPDEKLLDIWRGQRLRHLGELHNLGRRAEIPLCSHCTFA